MFDKAEARSQKPGKDDTMKKIMFVLVSIIPALIIVSHTITNAAWQIEEVDAPKSFSNFYPRTIAVDGSNNPHIVYGGDHLYYAYYDGIVWHYETVDTSSGVGEYASLVLDAEEKVHISYFDSYNYDLKYATNKSGAWVAETVDSDGDVGL